MLILIKRAIFSEVRCETREGAVDEARAIQARGHRIVAFFQQGDLWIVEWEHL